MVPIDPQTGLRATDQCPVVIDEAFYEGEEPHQSCSRHGSRVVPVDATTARDNAGNAREGEDEYSPTGQQPSRPPAKEKPWWQLF